MLAAAVQLPASVADCCGAVEPEPAATAGIASTSTAQVAEPTDLMLMASPFALAWTDGPSIRVGSGYSS
jgi:hypothetical protein